MKDLRVYTFYSLGKWILGGVYMKALGYYMVLDGDRINR